MKSHRQQPPWFLRKAKNSGHALTVKNTIDRLAADLGRPPSDAEVAAMLATTERHVRRHRARLANARGDAG